MKIARLVLLLSLFASLVAPAFGAGGPMVNESAREIPVVYDVDVVVVGGGTGAVSAAVAAAGEGADVFLAAPYPYLGDDMTATLRLWLDEGEVPITPLARRIFNDRDQGGARHPNAMSFTYEADLASSGVHKDTSPPSMLCDGKWGDAPKQSVQYDGDVTITADLGEVKPISQVRVVFYRRAGPTDAGGGFDVQTVTVSISDNKQSWREVAEVKNEAPLGGETCEMLSAPIGAETRYVKFAVAKPTELGRLLLGEIEIIARKEVRPETVAVKVPPPRPMHVKKTLDEVLLGAGVKFLYSCMATDVLVDAKGDPCGIVMANRAGRQAVLAKTIIDATDRATVARLAGAKFRAYPAGMHTFKRTVIGGEPLTGQGLSHRIVLPPYTGPYPNRAGTSSGVFEVIEYTLQLPMKDASYASWAAADQRARTLTYHDEQQFTSDLLFEVAPDAIEGRQPVTGPWTGVEKLPLGAFQPEGVARVYVLGGCADVSRQQAEKLLRPLALMDVGERVGKAAAAEAAAAPKPSGAKLPGEPVAAPVAAGDVKEFLAGVRPTQEKLPTVPQPERAIPVLGQYDVVVIGGGTGGAPAGIGAARQGAKTLVVEYLHGLGGVGTLGAISSYYWGNRVGFTATIPGGGRWVIEQRMEWYRRELIDAGADVWFGTLGCGALVDGGRVIGAVVVTPFGRGVVLARTVIDSTGNSDVAAAAGAETIYTDASEFGMQGTGLPGRKLGETYNNTDFTIVDETDMLDVWRMFVFSKEKYPDAFDHGRLIDTRERRRIVGDRVMNILDQMNERTYPDTICIARSNFDTHGYTVDPYLILEHPDKKGVNVHIPYGCYLPKGFDGILVTGLGISCHRDAVPLTRMQPDIQNGGYACGVAAAMAAKADVPARKVDLKSLQQHLVEVGNLPSDVLDDEDSYPLPDEQVAEAVESVGKGGHGAAVILAAADRAVPLMKEAYAKAASRDQKLVYARALCTMGEKTGLEDLMAEVEAATGWDPGWNYRGMGQFGSALSPLDNLIVAMGRARDAKALPVILEKVALLDAGKEFSHHRAVGLALELIGERAAAGPLAELLAKPGMTGYAQTDIQKAVERGAPGGTNAEQGRRESLRELLLARALYRCGDHEGLGERILRE